MENAGRAVFIECRRIFQRRKIENPSILIVAGPGHNGGDGFVAARHFFNNGYAVEIAACFEKKELRGDSLVNSEILQKLKIPFIESVHETLLEKLDRYDVFIDALFGIGLNRPISGFFSELIDRITQLNRPLISVDVPSGLNAEEGRPMGACFKACDTITMGALKMGFKEAESKMWTGNVHLADISLPPAVLSDASQD